MPLTYLPAAPRRVLISINPHAGARPRRQVAEALAAELTAGGWRPEIFTDVAQLGEAAERWLAAGELRCVVAGGGDGTFSLVANRTPSAAPLLVLPLGTENLLARYLSLSADVQRLARLIAEGACLRMDAGSANGRLFSLMAGCGFDAEVVRRLHARRTGNIDHFAYAKPILDAIRNYEYPELRVYCDEGEPPPEDGQAHDGRAIAGQAHDAHDGQPGGRAAGPVAARWVFVVNLPRYAGAEPRAPAPLGCDGLLDVCTFKAGSLWNGLWYLGGVALGQHRSLSDFAHFRARRVRIESAAPAPFQLDGDPGGELPLEIAVLPQRLNLVVDAAWAARQGFAEPLARAAKVES